MLLMRYSSTIIFLTFFISNALYAQTIPGDSAKTDLLVRLVFTPNNDGINDVFFIEGISHFDNNRVMIFNRWGNMIWEMEGYDNDDPLKSFRGFANTRGMNGSENLPFGTYYYIIDKGDNSKPQKGFVVLKN